MLPNAWSLVIIVILRISLCRVRYHDIEVVGKRKKKKNTRAIWIGMNIVFILPTLDVMPT